MSRAKASRLTADEWQHWEDRYTYGNMTLEDLADTTEAPHITTLKERSRARNWVMKRQHVADRITSRARELAEVGLLAILERHAEHGLTLQNIAVEGLNSIVPERLKPRDLLEFMKAGVEIEANARGLNTKRVELTGQNGAPLVIQHDLSSATSEALLEAYRQLLND